MRRATGQLRASQKDWKRVFDPVIPSGASEAMLPYVASMVLRQVPELSSRTVQLLKGWGSAHCSYCPPPVHQRLQ